jgi:hypothetical protein
MFPFDLRLKLYIGFTVAHAALDEKFKSSRYMIHIPELMPFIGPEKGIWCFNGMNTLQIVDIIKPRKPIVGTHSRNIYGSVIYRDKTDDMRVGTIKQGMIGKFSPLLPSVKYYIQFIENDINSGQIIRPVPYDIECKITTDTWSNDHKSPLYGYGTFTL